MRERLADLNPPERQRVRAVVQTGYMGDELDRAHG